MNYSQKTQITNDAAQPASGGDELFFVHSSHGLLRIDGAGFVVDKEICRPGTCDNCIDQIERFDLDEYRQTYGRLDTDFDILNLGGKMTSGELFPADAEFRSQISTTD